MGPFSNISKNQHTFSVSAANACPGLHQSLTEHVSTSENRLRLRSVTPQGAFHISCCHVYSSFTVQQWEVNRCDCVRGNRYIKMSSAKLLSPLNPRKSLWGSSKRRPLLENSHCGRRGLDKKLPPTMFSAGVCRRLRARHNTESSNCRGQVPRHSAT